MDVVELKEDNDLRECGNCGNRRRKWSAGTVTQGDGLESPRYYFKCMKCGQRSPFYRDLV